MHIIDQKPADQFVDFIDLTDKDLEEVSMQGTGAKVANWGWSCGSCGSCWSWSWCSWSWWGCGSCSWGWSCGSCGWW